MKDYRPMRYPTQQGTGGHYYQLSENFLLIHAIRISYEKESARFMRVSTYYHKCEASTITGNGLAIAKKWVTNAGLKHTLAQPLLHMVCV